MSEMQMENVISEGNLFVESVIAFLQNEWVVGIGGGIISGILVYCITSFFLTRRKREDYRKQIVRANEEVVSILKPYIANKGLPDSEILNSLISSISRKHNIIKADMYSIEVFCQELIREVMENVYIQDEQKENLTKDIQNYTMSLSKNVTLEPEFVEYERKMLMEKERMFERQSEQIRSISFLVAMLAPIILGLVSIFLLDKDQTESVESILQEFSSDNSFFMLLVFPVLLIPFAIIYSCFLRYKKEINKKDSEILSHLDE